MSLKNLNMFYSYDIDKEIREFAEFAQKPADLIGEILLGSLKQNNFMNRIGIDNFEVELKEGEVVYMNLGLGFGTELFGGHWCYVAKCISRSTVLIIPLTSVSTKHLNRVHMPTCELVDIRFDDSALKSICCINYSQARTVSIGRINKNKSRGKLLKPHKAIMKKLRQIIL